VLKGRSGPTSSRLDQVDLTVPKKSMGGWVLFEALDGKGAQVIKDSGKRYTCGSSQSRRAGVRGSRGGKINGEVLRKQGTEENPDRGRAGLGGRALNHWGISGRKKGLSNARKTSKGKHASFIRSYRRAESETSSPERRAAHLPLKKSTERRKDRYTRSKGSAKKRDAAQPDVS